MDPFIDQFCFQCDHAHVQHYSWHKMSCVMNIHVQHVQHYWIVRWVRSKLSRNGFRERLRRFGGLSDDVERNPSFSTTELTICLTSPRSCRHVDNFASRRSSRSLRVSFLKSIVFVDGFGKNRTDSCPSYSGNIQLCMYFSCGVLSSFCFDFRYRK